MFSGTLTGRLGTDPASEDGKVSFVVANHVPHFSTTWVLCECTDRVATLALDRLHKGDLVQCFGTIEEKKFYRSESGRVLLKVHGFELIQKVKWENVGGKS